MLDEIDSFVWYLETISYAIGVFVGFLTDTHIALGFVILIILGMLFLKILWNILKWVLPVSLLVGSGLFYWYIYVGQ